MRSFGFILAILVISGGYLAYQEGYLARFHPLLDPASETETEERQVPEPPVDLEAAPEEPGFKSKDPASDAKAKRDQLRKEQAAKAEEKKQADAERVRLAREERAAKQQQDAANKLRDAEERAAFNRQVDLEVEALRTQYNELLEKRATLDSNMRAQEIAWARESIKTREEDRIKLRDSTEAYRKNLGDQMNQVQDQIRAKLKERR